MKNFAIFGPSYFHLFAAVMYLFLAGYVLLHDTESKLHRFGAAFFLCSAVWSGSFVFVHFPFTGRRAAEIALDVSSVGGLLYPLFLFLFVIALAELRAYKVSILLALLAGALLVLQWGTPHEVVSVIGEEPATYGWVVRFDESTTGLFYACYSFLALLPTAAVLIWMWRSPGRFPRIRRTQAKILLTGGVASVILTVVTDLVQRKLSVSASLSTDLMFLLWAGIMFYTILRYRLFRLSPRSAAEQLISSVSEAILLVRPDGTVAFANEATRTLTGRDPSDIEGTGVGSVLRPVEGDATLFARVEPIGSKRLELIDSAGRGRPVLLSRVPVADDSGDTVGAAYVVRDITEYARIEADLHRKQRFESLAETAGGIAHDLNNMLSAVVGYVDLAEMTLPVDHEASEYLRTVQEAFPRLTDLTTQLLTLSKGRIAVREACRLEHIVEASTLLALSGSSVEPQISVSPNLLSVEVDEGQISQVITNLSVNAKQAMDGSGTVSYALEDTTVTESAGGAPKPGRYVRLVIHDEGPGISHEVADRIFDPFFSTKDSGSGLGLSTSMSIIEAHGGSIRLLPTNRGACFEILLPACDERATDREPSTPAQYDLPGGACLIMDDDPEVRRTEAAMLRSLGFDPVEASDGEEAIRIVRSYGATPDPLRFVVLDLTVKGGMGGAEALPHLRRAEPELPILLATGYLNNRTVEKPDAHGFTATLNKPIQLAELRRVLREVLAE